MWCPYCLCTIQLQKIVIEVQDNRPMLPFLIISYTHFEKNTEILYCRKTFILLHCTLSLIKNFSTTGSFFETPHLCHLLGRLLFFRTLTILLQQLFPQMLFRAAWSFSTTHCLSVGALSLFCATFSEGFKL